MWPSASSATSSCSSVSGRIWTAPRMFSAIRRIAAACASDSCGATGVRSGASMLLLPPLVETPGGVVEHGVGYLVLARARHPPLTVLAHQHNLVGVRVEADIR